MNAILIKWSRHWLISGEHLYRRLLQLAVAVILLVWLGLTWFHAEQRGEAVRVLHTEQLARVILSQASHEARIWISENNMIGLHGLAQHLHRQDGILEVTVQDSEGRVLVKVGHDASVQGFLNSLPTSMWAVPLVTPVDNGREVTGFVRITFDYNRLMAKTHLHQRQYQRSIGFMLFLAVLAGALLATALLKRRPRQVIAPDEPSSSSFK